jgi:hypothetical protein
LLPRVAEELLTAQKRTGQLSKVVHTMHHALSATQFCCTYLSEIHTQFQLHVVHHFLFAVLMQFLFTESQLHLSYEDTDFVSFMCY